MRDYVQLNLDGSDSHPSVGDRGGGRLGRVQGGVDHVDGAASGGSVIGHCEPRDPNGMSCVQRHCSDCSDAVQATGPGGGALGSLTGYCPGSTNPAAACESVSATDVQNSASNPLDALMSSFELRARLRKIAADARIAKCGSVVYTDPTLVTEEYDDGSRRAHWTGVAMCNRAGCPVCGAAKARKFRDQCLRTLGSGGGYWHHVILTVPHHAGESWGTVYERLLDGMRGLSRGQCGRVVMSQVSATIRATETTWSMRAGWHVHLHLMWRLERPMLQAERWIVRSHWAESTGASLRHGCTFGLHFECSDDQRRRQAASYISKIADEMSGAHKSAHPEHWTLGELYQRAAEDPDFVPLIQQYQRETKGRRLYQLDRRAKLLHDAAPELPHLRVAHTWVTVVDRMEFRALSRLERFGGDALACYLPLEVAIRARGDPRSWVEDTIYSLISGR